LYPWWRWNQILICAWSRVLVAPEPLPNLARVKSKQAQVEIPSRFGPSNCEISCIASWISSAWASSITKEEWI
jgi:hypothetical protein